MPSETPKKYLQNLLNSALKDLGFPAANLEITVPEPRFGDYASNAALVLAKQVKQNPKAVAAQIIEQVVKLDADKNIASATEAGGFINFTLTTNFLAESACQLTTEIKIEPIGAGQKVVFEYSSPNTNKPLHIGHTRNDVYGMACINLLKAVGYNVTSCEIINDRGIHIMKSVLMYQKFGAGKTPQSEKIKPDRFVGGFYVMFAQEAAKSPEAEKQLLEQAQELLQKWEAGDAEVRKTWEKMNSWFYEGIKQTYEKEGSHFDEVDYESQIFNKGREVVMAGLGKGIFKQEADGSVYVDLTEEGLDKKYLLRKDGTTIYITQDMYLWFSRNEKYHPNLAIVTTAAEQAYHFKVLKRIFELLDYPWAKNFKHLPYEHVFLGQNKMSSRGGNTVSADDLLGMTKDKVRNLMQTLEKAKGDNLNDILVEQIAFGAIKYGYLKYEPNTRIYFDVEQTISLQGNTGPYVQYAFARINSILHKAGMHAKVRMDLLSLPEETSLIKSVLNYQDIVLLAARDYKPNLLCNYLYELAAEFNRFYSAVPVLATEDIIMRDQRLTLLDAVSNVLKHGLNLLGIESPPEM